TRRNARRVGTHVGDETDGAFRTDIHTFVQLLRGAHGTLRGEAEALRCLLLQRRCGERRGRVLESLTTLELGNDERHVRDIVQRAGRALLVLELERLAVDVMELRLELPAVLLEQCS